MTLDEIRADTAQHFRNNAITRFALDFLKANLDALQADNMLEGFGGKITADEIDRLKERLGVQFS